MMTRGFIVYKVHADKLVLHDHPVFTGEAAYDIPNRGQEVMTDAKLNVRLFTSEGEVITAVQDYIREETEQTEIEPWFVICRYSVNQVKFKNVKSKQSNKN